MPQSKPRFRSAFLLLLLLALSVGGSLAAPVLAADGSLALQLDPEATEAAFVLGATGHDVEGHLYLQSGSLELTAEGASGGVAEGELVLDARKTETGNGRRDRTMHKKVLESAIHPRIVFRAERFTGALPSAGEGDLEISGQVELLGQDHPVTLEVHYQLAAGRFDADVRLDVPFIEWGLHDPSILFLKVEKVVHVQVSAVGTIPGPASAGASAGAGRP